MRVRSRDPDTARGDTLWQRLAKVVGHTRFVVFVAVVAVLLVAVSLFLLGAYEAVTSVVGAWTGITQTGIDAPEITVLFLRVVILMLEAVAFFIVGVGLYGLFLAPLNITEALGVETLGDLEERVLSVIVVILAVTFLEHFIGRGDAMELLRRAAAFAAAVLAIAAFHIVVHRARMERDEARADVQDRSRHDMFQGHEELHDVGSPPDDRKREASAE